MARTKIVTALEKNFSAGDTVSGFTFTTGGAWTTSGGYMTSLGAFDSSPRFAQQQLNNCPAVIEVTVPVQDGFGMTMGGNAGSKSVCFEMVKVGTEFVYKLYMTQNGSMQDSAHQLYSETSMPWTEGQEVRLMFSMTRHGWHVAEKQVSPSGPPHKTFLELRSFVDQRSGGSSTFKDSTRRFSGVFATRPGVQIKYLKISNILAIGMNYGTGSTKTAFYDDFNGAGNWNTATAATPTGSAPTTVYTVGLNGTASTHIYNGGYLQIAANTAPVGFLSGVNTEWAGELVYNDGSVWHVVFDYFGGLPQLKFDAGPWTLHVNSTVTGAATALALESPGGKGPNVFTNVGGGATSVANGQFVHVVIAPTPVSETTNSWKYPMQSGTTTMYFYITSSASIPTYGSHVGSFSISAASAPTLAIGCGAATCYLQQLGVYNRDMSVWNTADATYSKTTPQDFFNYDAPFETTRTAAHVYKGMDRIYNKVVTG